MPVDPLQQPKILYIEDNPEARTLVSRLLAREYVMLETGDPLDGIELAVETRPDLVLLDINLPQMSGREVAARLNSLLPDTVLVALSAESSAEARQKALAAGFAGFIAKPIDIDTFSAQIAEFLHGKRETAPNLAQVQHALTAEVAANLEEKVRELTRTLQRNEFLNQQNQHMINLLKRRQRLLEAGLRVGQVITSVLSLEELLPLAAQTISAEYGFAKAEILLGTQPEAQTTAMRLPLRVKDETIGLLSVTPRPGEIISEDDLTALNSLTTQVAIAVNNARLLRDLHKANEELLRNKTFQAIATATGEAIHWVGNKAAPIPASAARVRQDLREMGTLFRSLLNAPNPRQHPNWAKAEEIFAQLPAETKERLLPLGIESTLEDLDVIEQSATTILNIKEDLIGPVRLRRDAEIDLTALLRQTIYEMALPEEVIRLEAAANLPLLRGDARQLSQVFNNLIKNAWEAMQGQERPPRIQVALSLVEEKKALLCQVSDNGPGIPPEILEKIWVAFFTTKGDRGGTGLGLMACMEIVRQMQGEISVQSAPGKGAVFSVLLPLSVS